MEADNDRSKVIDTQGALQEVSKQAGICANALDDTTNIRSRPGIGWSIGNGYHEMTHSSAVLNTGSSEKCQNLSRQMACLRLPDHWRVRRRTPTEPVQERIFAQDSDERGYYRASLIEAVL